MHHRELESVQTKKVIELRTRPLTLKYIPLRTAAQLSTQMGIKRELAACH